MTFYRQEDPTPCPEGYTLDCYCDHENDEHDYKEFPQAYFTRNEREAKQAAKKRGWKFHKDGTATCGKCMARKRRGDKPEGAPI